MTFIEIDHRSSQQRSAPPNTQQKSAKDGLQKEFELIYNHIQQPNKQVFETLPART